MGRAAFAAEGAKEEPSKTAFVIIGACLAAYAVLVSAVGIRAGGGDFPGTKGRRNAVMLVSLLIVAATLAASVATS